jgi:hypothetical protein
MKKYLFLILAVCFTTAATAQNNARKNKNERKAAFINFQDIKGERNQNQIQVKEKIQRKKPVARRRKA